MLPRKPYTISTFLPALRFPANQCCEDMGKSNGHDWKTSGMRELTTEHTPLRSAAQHGRHQRLVVRFA